MQKSLHDLFLLHNDFDQVTICAGITHHLKETKLEIKLAVGYLLGHWFEVVYDDACEDFNELIAVVLMSEQDFED